MQQGPDTGIGETFVETSGFFFAKKDRNTAIFFGEPLLNFPLPIFVGECGTRPTDPFSFELFFGKSFQSRHQATGRRGDLTFLDGYGQTIGDIDESARHCDFNVRDCSTSWLSVIHARAFSPVAVPTSIPRERILRKRGLACSGTVYRARFFVGDAERALPFVFLGAESDLTLSGSSIRSINS